MCWKRDGNGMGEKVVGIDVEFDDSSEVKREKKKVAHIYYIPILSCNK